ncbi:MAG: DNA translocase FtsK 4TM domain-containing protein, partial [Bacteroidota bacterium]
MANKNQQSLKFTDDRIPKLFGMVVLFLAAYLFIAFFSYLFTWGDDYAEVNSKSLGEIFSDSFQASNLLGRLGALVSNTFFWWMFGVPSFFVVYLLAHYGISMVKRHPLRVHQTRLRTSLVWMLFLSIFLEFIFGKAEFPWGGAFGEAVSAWMTGFVGILGMIVLFLFIFVGIIVWSVNPNFNELTLQTVQRDTKLWFSEIFNRRYLQRKPQPPVPATATETPTPIRASVRPQVIAKGEGEENGGAELAEVVEAAPKPEKPKAIRPGDGTDFEIAAPPPSPVAEPDETAQAITPTPSPRLPVPAPQASLFPDIEAAQQSQNFSEPYDPTLELSSYEYPVLALLNDYADQKIEIDRGELEANKDQIVETLLNYKIEIVKIRATIGPTVTLYEIVPAPGVRISRIKNLEDDIALSLAALGIRIIAPIPGRGTIGIEVPNKNKQIVALKELLMSEKFKRGKYDLPIALGKTIANEVFVVDLTKMPHLLIAGATGQGKSVGINCVLLSLLYKKHPSQVKLVLIDPKKVELFPYAKLLQHFLAFLPGQEEPITTDTSKVVNTLNSLCIEMESRYNLMKKAHARNIQEYNEKFVARRLNPNNGHAFMPYIVLVIDEFADLIMTAGKEIELPIGRLAQLARAVGIHLIIATQRPSV